MKDIFNFSLQLLNALRSVYMAKGFIHRDIKP